MSYCLKPQVDSSFFENVVNLKDGNSAIFIESRFKLAELSHAAPQITAKTFIDYLYDYICLFSHIFIL